MSKEAAVNCSREVENELFVGTNGDCKYEFQT